MDAEQGFTNLAAAEAAYQQERAANWPQDSTRQQETRFWQWLGSASDAEVGTILKEYLLESAHSGWDGFTFRQLLAFRRLFADINRFRESM